MASNNELYHYGVKGMKWGVRRYQNKDGSLTNAGRARRRKSEDSKIRDKRKKDLKNRRKLSDKELNDRINRLSLEKKYKQLAQEDLNPGRTAAKNFLKTTGGKILTSAAVGGLAYLGHYAITGKFDPQQAAGYIFPNPNKKK